MKLKFDKSAVQAHICHKAGMILEKFLSEDLYRNSFVFGVEVWTYRYDYHSKVESDNEIICYGQLKVRAKKKYRKFIKEPEHDFLFQARILGKYDIEIQLKPMDKNNI